MTQDAARRPGALEDLRTGGKLAVARALAAIEAGRDLPGTAALLDAAFSEPLGVSLGLTGPPGVGKSTLIDALIRGWRAQGRTIAVIAVDPSSVRSGGALLGDRTRLSTDPGDTGVFVRSMAAREMLGGIAEETFPAMVLLRALFDLVVVETVGVGQSEVSIRDVTDLTAYCAQPGSGDALQYMKAGVMEIPDLVIVTKTDMGAPAARTVSDLKGALSLSADDSVPVLACSATTGQGMDAVLGEISARAARFSPKSANRRTQQLIRWAEAQIVGRFGREGLKLVHSPVVDKPEKRPFSCILGQTTRLSDALSAAFR